MERKYCKPLKCIRHYALRLFLVSIKNDKRMNAGKTWSVKLFASWANLLFFSDSTVAIY